MATHTITPANNIAAILGEIEAGDTLLLRGGIYNQGEIDINVSGTADAPIKIANYPDEDVIWQTGARDRILDIAGSYIIVTGIEFDKQDGRKEALRLVGNHITVQHCHIHNCRYDMMVFVVGTDCVLENNEIHSNGNGPDRDAHAVITRGTAHRLQLIGNEIYDVCGDCYQSNRIDGEAQDILLENNHLYTTLGWRSENAIDSKAGSGIARGNFIHGFRATPEEGDGATGDWPSGGSGEGIRIHTLSRNWLVEGNTIFDCTIGIRISDYSCQSIRMINNTITDLAFDDEYGWTTNGIRVTGVPDGSAVIGNRFDVGEDIALEVDSNVLVEDNIFNWDPEPTTTTTTSTSTTTSTTLAPEPTTTTTTSTSTTTTTLAPESTTTTTLPPEPDWKPDILAAIEAMRAAQNAQIDALQDYVEGY